MLEFAVRCEAWANVVRRLLWLGWLCSAAAWAVTDERLPTEAEIAARIAAVQDDSAFPQAQRDKLLAEYRAALESVRETGRYRERVQELQREVTAAPAQIRDVERRLERGPDLPALDGSASYETLDKLLAEAQVALSAAQTRALDARHRAEQLERAPPELQQAIKGARGEREAAARQLTALQPLQATTAERQARQQALRAAVAAKDAQLAALNAELETLAPRLDLATAQRRLADAEVEWTADRVARLQDLLSGRRGDVVDRVRREALQLTLQADAQPERVAAETRANVALAERLADLIAKLGEVADQQRALRSRVEAIRELRATAADQLEIAQLGGTLGRVLHQQRQQLPNLVPDAGELRRRAEVIALARFAQLELRAELKAHERAGPQFADALHDLPAAEREVLRRQLREQWERRTGLLSRLDRTYTAYIADLGALDQLERELIGLAGDYAALLNRDLVWIADAPRLSWGWPLAAVSPLLAVADVGLWRQLAGAFAQGWERKPLVLALALLAVLAGFYYRPRLRVWLTELGESVGDPDRDRFGATLGALLLSFLLALPLPLALGFLALALRTGGDDQLAFAAALARGLLDAALIALVLEFARVASRSGGLLDRHLGCHARMREVLLRSLRWLLPLLAVGALLVGATNLSGHHVDTLGRAAFAIGAAALSLFIWRALHPETGLLAEYFVQARRHGWQWNLRRLWFGILALLPVAFGILALSGYYYTAQQLLSRFCATGLLLAAVVLGRQIALRGLALFEQRLARQQALARRDAARRRDEEKEIEAQGEATVEVAEAHEVDVGAVNVQVRVFLRVGLVLLLGSGLWWIWAELLPALAALREIVLWEYTSGSGDNQRLLAVTAAGLGLALLVAVITYLAARNLPGLLEVVVLQRFEVDAGARYAANAVSRYLIIVVGALVVINMLGLEWSKLQWLVAALGVGLGFGLQEVVGNFVSGLIILFERPFRIGDTVTIGSVSGTVTRIQIRATTITDWDRKELIVPNKMFITDQLVNWTLNDPVLRVVVRVGIAYGSDTELARRLLIEIAEANPRALADPAPQVWFMGFGESSLNFEVRVFVQGLPEILPATHELHEAIDAAFRRHGIEIAFPQRDLHLRTLDPRVAELLRGQGLPAPSPQAPA
ncbi:MAG: hypothetical protein AMXMBFR26_15340 [Porticoccaceae bacterium]